MAGAERSIGTAVRDGIHARDLFLLALVPVALVGVFSLPLQTREAYAFDYTDPTLLTAFTAHFVHLSADYLLANVASFIVLASVGYVLAVLAGRRRLFGAALATYLLGFPPVLSALNLAIPRPALGYGFSGINMAIVGLLPVLLFAFAREWLHPGIRQRDAPVLFFVAVGLIALLGLPGSVAGRNIALVAGAAALLYAVALLEELFERGRWGVVAGLPWSSREGDVFVFGLLLFLGFQVVAFPAAPQDGYTVLNTYIHLLAFSLGFLVPFIAVEFGWFD